ATDLGLKVNAGHGLDYYNVYEIARIPEIKELNIGFSIIAQAVSVGMQKATRQMRKVMKGRKI
ncbi:MAG: pyridoxine 5'-phosphate synthase, partial [Candidatus Saganbacteria bacterium]|nr:pyridoxine 5'-phosphate synthase [Candidatus Saganbacteria bacterium]